LSTSARKRKNKIFFSLNNILLMRIVSMAVTILNAPEVNIFLIRIPNLSNFVLAAVNSD